MAAAGSVARGVWLVWCLLLLVEGTSCRSSQKCGDRLADLLALVCYGRGYNLAFRPERSSVRRYRRGIVEECCRNSCSHEILESYCRPVTTTEPYNSVPIRKRSDSVERMDLDQTEDLSKRSTYSKADTRKTLTQNNADIETSTTTERGSGENYKILNLLVPPGKHNTKGSNEKLTPNDTTEDESYRHSDFPNLRHKSHHHGMTRFRNRKNPMKIKKGGSSETFQIGVVKPYFSGRGLASYSGSYTAPS